MKPTRHALYLLFSISLVLTVYLYRNAILVNPQGVYTLHQELVAGQADSPNRYRVLVPHVVEAIRMAVKADAVTAVCVSYLPFYWIAVTASLFAIFAYLSLWYAPLQALLGSLLASIAILIAFADGYFTPWSLIEVALFTGGLYFSYRKRYVWLWLMVILGSLNRETGVFIAMVPLLTGVSWKEAKLGLAPSLWGWSALYGATWAAIFGGLRLLLGMAPPAVTLSEVFAQNIDGVNLLSFAFFGLIFLGSFWGFVFRGYRNSPAFIRGTWRVAAVYLVIVAICGIWREVRLLTPLCPILISTGLGSFVTALAGQTEPVIERIHTPATVSKGT